MAGKLKGFGPGNNKELMAPAFKLNAAQGGIVASWDYKQIKPLVLYFLPEPNKEFLQKLQSEAGIYQAVGTQLLVIVTAKAERLAELPESSGLSFPLLADPQGETYKKYLALTRTGNEAEAWIDEYPAAVFVADRFGAISRYATALRPEELPTQSEILDFIEFLGNLCNP
ncbi:MAG TPA: redoxin domain-containing protein [Chloroflexia bacterium]|nr:redoxin domain-containing protein [Chloroflexia bacterium]